MRPARRVGAEKSIPCWLLCRRGSCIYGAAPGSADWQGHAGGQCPQPAGGIAGAGGAPCLARRKKAPRRIRGSKRKEKPGAGGSMEQGKREPGLLRMLGGRRAAVSSRTGFVRSTFMHVLSGLAEKWKAPEEFLRNSARRHARQGKRGCAPGRLSRRAGIRQRGNPPALRKRETVLKNAGREEKGQKKSPRGKGEEPLGQEENTKEREKTFVFWDLRRERGKTFAGGGGMFH